MFRRLTNSKAWVLVVGMLAVAALVFLSAGLPNLRFDKPGQFVMERPAPLGLPGGRQTEGDSDWLTRLIIITAVLVLVGIVLALCDRKSRKRIFRFLFYAALFILVASLVNPVEEGVAPAATPPPAADGPGGVSATAPPYVPPAISSLTAFLVALGLMLAALAVGYYAWSRRRLSPRSEGDSLSDLQHIAQSTLDELASGRDWEDAVIRCYERMIEAVASQRGLYRKRGMTPAEFAGYLELAGLPSQSVQRLTHLFESARYGEKRSTRSDASEAVACLSDIVVACGPAIQLTGRAGTPSAAGTPVRDGRTGGTG
jgi:hypothetical protein